MPREESKTTTVMTNDPRALAKDARRIQTTTAQFDAAFLEHWQAIYRVLVRLVGDAAEAEDLALETFWRLYQRPPTNERAENLGGWLYCVATNLGLNALRARKRRAHHELDAGKWALEASDSDPAQNVIREQERALVRQVLGEMDERQAQLLFLRHSGLSYAELSDALDVAPASIGTLLARAEREFEKRYRQKGDA